MPSRLSIGDRTACVGVNAPTCSVTVRHISSGISRCSAMGRCCVHNSYFGDSLVETMSSCVTDVSEPSPILCWYRASGSLWHVDAQFTPCTPKCHQHLGFSPWMLRHFHASRGNAFHTSVAVVAYRVVAQTDYETFETSCHVCGLRMTCTHLGARVTRLLWYPKSGGFPQARSARRRIAEISVRL